MIARLFKAVNENYKLKHGIYPFINGKKLTGDNLKYSRMYDKIARIYHLSQRIYFFFNHGSERKFREPFLSELEIQNGDEVLEIPTGTTDNFHFLSKAAYYVGVDISMGMLAQARKHCKQWKLNCDLVHCEGESLPFKDEAFDVVFHCGGINYFNDKQKAVLEMICVVKGGLNS